MCGIAGFVGRIDAAARAAVDRAHAAQVHRGPDADGRWSSIPEPPGDGAGVVLAHRRLAIVDLSADGVQPMQHSATGNVVVFNGEIYNFRELREELRTLGHEFRTRTDTEVLLAAYAAWGRAALARLRGMFAFALWDAREHALLLARDRLGIKPLYWTRDGDRVCFASELRALLAAGVTERKLDPQGLGTFLWNGFVVGPATLVRGIESFPAGSSCVVHEDGRAEAPERYWNLPAGPGRGTDPAVLRERLHEAASQHLVGDVPLGVFLSGGVDSSAVAALSARASSTRLRTFHVGFDETEFDESAYARRVAAAIGSEHHELRLTEARFHDQLDGALASLDQPTFDALNSYFVSRAVREAGLTVALSGAGGDELFGGYRSFRDVPRAARFARRARFVPEPWLRGAAGVVSRLRSGRPGAVPPQTRWGKLADALATRGDLLAAYQVAYGLFTRSFLEELSSSPSTLAAVREGLPPARAEELRRSASGRSESDAVSSFEQSMFLGERLLRDTDAASMAVSLEARVPLLDHEVVEAVSALDDRTRFHPLGRKQLLRDLALDGIDRAIFERPKRGFELPLEVWCRRRLEIRMDQTFGDPALCASAGLAQPAVAKLWSAFRSGAPGLYWSRIWSLYVLLDWCRTHGVSR